MCVIYVANTKWPDEEELARGSDKNDDGAGIAWLAGVKGTLMVHWQKGFKDHTEILEFIKTKNIPLPAIIHFRTVSVGGKCPELCHPFPVVEGAPLWLAGYAEQVIFHNGHIGNWEDLVLKAGIASDEEFPGGVWSDTRGLAWLMHLKGPGVIPFVLGGSRVAHFFANSTKLKSKNYDKLKDHIVLHGSWIHKEGFSQSIETDSANRGGVYIRGKKVSSTSGVILDWEADAPDKADETKWKSCGESRALLTASIPPTGLNEWDLSECQVLLTAIEKEQKDAATATA